MQLNRDSSLARFQRKNEIIYRAVNDVGYNPETMFKRLHEHVISIVKGVRKERYEQMEYQLCMALSWSFALANRYHIDLEAEMWTRFPGRCPYCTQSPCACSRDRVKDRQKTIGMPEGTPPKSLYEWQLMFRKIYRNQLLESAFHMVEETGEVYVAIVDYSTTHEKFEKIIEELVDLITNIFSVASSLHIDVAACMAGFFNKGCPRCKKPQCICEYTIHVEPVRLYIKKGGRRYIK